MSATPDYDTGPLNWVRGDIDAALQAALGRIQAFSLDAELTNALRLAHDDAHQVTGALRMVGLEGAATVAAAMESCLADINENRLPANDEMLRALRNGLEGLQRWIKDLADGRGSGELALFPLYKRLREMQGAERVFEGELFFPDLRTRVQGKAANKGLSQEALTAKVKAARGQFQLGLLAFLRNVDAQQGLTRMREALAAIEQVAPSQASHTFWWACVGFVDSLIAHGVEADFHVKQLLARVDLQMRRLMEGSPQVAERLLRDALFFVAKSQSIDGCAADVRSTFGLDRYLPGRGLLDPETMARMRPVLEALGAGLKAAHDSWHAYVEGNAEQLAQFQSLLDRMQPQARMLRDSGLSPLLQDLSAAAGASAERDGEAREQMNLEVASTLLFLQNAVEHEDVLHADFAGRAESQQARLRAMIEGREVPSAEVESSTQREAERDMLVHMAQEVGQNLRQMEAALDAFFRDAGEREALAGLPALAQQAQGALTMLELTDAASLLAAATAVVQPFASEGHPDDATQRRLADAFSSLGLFIESYCAGRADAARILRPVLAEFGVATADSDEEDAFSETVESGMPARKAGVKDAYLGWRDESDDGSKKKYLDALTELNRDAELIDDAVLKQQTRAALDASREVAAPPISLDAALAELTGLEMPERLETVSTVAGETELPPIELSEISLDFADTPAPVEPAVEMESLEWAAPAEPLIEIPQPAAVAEVEPVAVTEVAVPASADHVPVPEDVLRATIPEGVEPELLEIFLEEVNEVLATMGEAVEACQSNPDDQSSMTVIRRGFHTLKGSGRMVGLTELGETAWRHEQLMNGWLAENKPASSDLLRLVSVSRSLFQDWVNALHANNPVALPVPALLAAVDRVAQGQPFEMAPVVEAAPIVEAAAPAIEAVAEMVFESVAEPEAVLAETFEFTPVAEAGTGTEEATGFEIEFQPVAGIEGEPEAALAETFEFTPVAEAGTETEEAAG
ncbi:MAG: hypothetical protein QG662_297, partial [Pseudomonadota bacterium]|nr:hypothetical protein [Pseudomonadota bacterium]